MTEHAPAPTIPEVRREVTVDVPIDRAFDVFTRRLDAWWPHDTHHIGPMPAIAVVEPRVDGRCYSLAEDGTQTDWGRVLVFEPPHRLQFAWMLTPDWQYEPDVARASDVTVTFTAVSPSQTVVTLIHAGFERYGDAVAGAAMRDHVDSEGGWGTLVGLYAACATRLEA
ncbi:MAG TPA: SRPBCC family protein [Baekduia sp.]|jgi:uncharacterized protein YndB with AHSA1/START domain|nr:SRPBCC family protein [Baekduia sp.]